MDKQVKCPWCSELVTPVMSINSKEYGNVKERKCPECNAVISAYVEEPRIVLEKVRLFQG